MRFNSKSPNSANPLVRVRLSGLALPSRLYCGYLAVPVRPWVPGPRQCRRCWEFGHVAATCKPTKQERCGRCSGLDHPAQGCKRAPFCIKCKEAHPMWRRDCRAWKVAKEGAKEAAFARQPSASGPWGPLAALPPILALSAEDFPPLPAPPSTPTPTNSPAPRGRPSKPETPKTPTTTGTVKRRLEEPSAPSKKRPATPGAGRVVTKTGVTTERGQRLSYSESDDEDSPTRVGESYDQSLVRAFVARVDSSSPHPQLNPSSWSDSVTEHHHH